MSRAVGVVFALGGLVCGGFMAYWYFIALWDWLGLLAGILVALFLIPGAAIFPFIYWIVEGSFPI